MTDETKLNISRRGLLGATAGGVAIGGMGLGGMQERADLIRCFYNTSFNLVSEPGKGSIITLEIELF